MSKENILPKNHAKNENVSLAIEEILTLETQELQYFIEPKKDNVAEGREKLYWSKVVGFGG